MFESIKSETLSVIKYEFMQKRTQYQSVFSYLFNRFLLFTLLSLMYIGLLVGLNKFFNFYISKSLMFSFVAVVELSLILSNKCFYNVSNSPFRSKDKYNKEYIDYHTDLLLYGYNNFIWNTYLILPFLMAYGIVKYAHFTFYVNTIIFIMLLPMTSILISMIIPHKVRVTNKFSYTINRIACNFISFLIYIIIFFNFRTQQTDLLLKLLSNHTTIYTEVSKVCNIPINIDKFLTIDVPEFLAMVINLIFNGMFQITFVVSSVVTFLVISVNIVSLLKDNKVVIFKLNKNKPFSTKANNIKVYRRDYIIKCCLPRSPDKEIYVLN